MFDTAVFSVEKNNLNCGCYKNVNLLLDNILYLLTIALPVWLLC